MSDNRFHHALAAIGKMAQDESGSIVIKVSALATALNTTPLRARHQLDAMESARLVEKELLGDPGDYRLSDLGREYIIQQDLDLDS